jgi:serpin B
MVARFLLGLILLSAALIPDAFAGDTAEQSLAQRNNRFALELYSRINSEAGNIFVSPYSISSAMAMVYEGARNETSKEIEDTFHFQNDADSRHRSWSESITALNGKKGAYLLSTANALWAE